MFSLYSHDISFLSGIYFGVFETVMARHRETSRFKRGCIDTAVRNWRYRLGADVPNPEQVLIREVNGSPTFRGATAFE